MSGRPPKPIRAHRWKSMYALLLAVVLLLTSVFLRLRIHWMSICIPLTLDIFADHFQLAWRITTGPLLANAAWFEADLNIDGEISAVEARAYVLLACYR